MGNLSSKLSGLCSKSSTHSGGHTLVDPTGIHESTHGANGTPIDARRAAAEAAEKRREAEQLRGVNRQNPKAGQIAAQLEALKSGTQEQDVIPDRVVWD